MRTNGILLVSKPKGPTSHDVVAMVRRMVDGAKVGHTGTLDPAASGLLVLCIGRMTRLARFFSDLRKEYRGTVLFGKATDTLDLEGRTVARASVPSDAWKAAVRNLHIFTGGFLQEPPKYSAIKWKGKPLHKWARHGKEPPLRSREVQVFESQAWGDNRSHRRLHFRLLVGSGFYVRSWARDLGASIGLPAILVALERTDVGPFNLRKAIHHNALTPSAIRDSLIVGERALPWIRTLEVGEERLGSLREGRVVEMDEEVAEMPDDGIVKVLDRAGSIALVGRLEGTQLKPWIVLHPSNEPAQ